MKRIPMSQEGRLKAAERKRKLSRNFKFAVIALAAMTAGLWSFLLADI